MPYSWIEPALFLEHNGVCVYHTYCEDNYNFSESKFEFTTTPLEYLEDATVFNVLDFNVPSAEKLRAPHPPFIRHGGQKDLALARQWERWLAEVQPALIKAAVREAIDAGLISGNDE